MKIQFTKMHGLGNDFVFVDGRRFKVANWKTTAKSLCDRRFGVGADQVLVLAAPRSTALADARGGSQEKSRKADFKMRIFNADGGEVGMCGNGLRCLAKYVRDEKISSKTEIRVETQAGIQVVKMVGKNKVTVDMGAPLVKGPDIPVKLSGRVINRPIRVDGKEFRATCVSMGNPHCILYVEDLPGFPVEKYGPIIERHHIFPKRTNVEFVRVISHDEIEMRVWERGAGETLACGSGACAATVASVLNGHTNRKVDVKLSGGVLEVEWRRSDDHVYMTGPAETVFKGEIEI